MSQFTAIKTALCVASITASVTLVLFLEAMRGNALIMA